MAAYGVHSLFDFNLHIPANVLLLAFVFGILVTPESDRGGDTAALPLVFGRFLLPALGLALLALAIRYMEPEAWAERARVALRDGHFLVATSWAEKALTLDDHNPETLFYLGESRVRCAEDLRNPAVAASFYRAALEPFQRANALAPNDETFLIALGRVYDALGRFPEADWMFGQALAWIRGRSSRKNPIRHVDLWRIPARTQPPPVDLPDRRALPRLQLPSPRRFLENAYRAGIVLLQFRAVPLSAAMVREGGVTRSKVLDKPFGGALIAFACGDRHA